MLNRACANSSGRRGGSSNPPQRSSGTGISICSRKRWRRSPVERHRQRAAALDEVDHGERDVAGGGMGLATLDEDRLRLILFRAIDQAQPRSACDHSKLMVSVELAASAVGR